MTSRDFCYWLQGLFELGAPASLSLEQTAAVKAHLAMVFIHEIDPSAGGPEAQKILQGIHDALAVEPNNPPPRIGGTSPDGKIIYRC